METMEAGALSALTPVLARVEEDLADLGRIGARAGGGVTRLAWSEEEGRAKAFLVERLARLGVGAESDEAANVWAEIGPEGAPVLAIGSHLDTVPDGGRYDGALGVMAGLETMRLLLEAGRPLKRRVRLAAFTDEEGARFGTGLFGSTAVATGHDIDHLAEVRDRAGVALAEAMAARGRRLEELGRARERLDDVEAYLELHVEQGPRLERMGRDIGVVTAITGIRQVEYTFAGETNHAGTTALADRRDALLPAAETILAVRRAAERSGGRAVGTVGYVAAVPGAANVVPGEAVLSVEVRSPESEVMAEVHGEIARAAEAEARRHGVEVVRAVRHHVAPAAMDPAWRERLRRQARALGEEPVDLVSWAGHDAGALAARLPVAMLFVPSRGGLSHAPGEYTAPERYRAGLTAFARTVAAWAWGLEP
ncbi:MAG: Zn-dependent hydrolase [Firmicutes bacterium]|nr:Zn-dependent hydrolase [Bacillota bacterium]